MGFARDQVDRAVADGWRLRDTFGPVEDVGKRSLILFWGPGLAGARELAQRLGWLEACYWNVPQDVPGRTPHPWGRLGPAHVRWRGREILVDLGYRGALWTPAANGDWHNYPGEDWKRFRMAQERSFRDAAAVLFVVDSQEARSEANLESLERLTAGFRHVGRDETTVPIVFALNKRDLWQRHSPVEGARILAVEELRLQLTWRVCEYIETSALTGLGVEAAIERVIELARLG
ncbi:MAG: GTPase domain-containing protein [Polyangiaceae bacterium]|nr:GTPase domain-containing protein [Polyangiaceae bacterium]